MLPPVAPLYSRFCVVVRMETETVLVLFMAALMDSQGVTDLQDYYLPSMALNQVRIHQTNMLCVLHFYFIHSVTVFKKITVFCKL